MTGRVLRFVFCMAVAFAAASSAMAHPMGNFSVNHYSKIEFQSNRILVRYFIDLAEIPTYQELQEANIAAAQGGVIDPSSEVVRNFVARRGDELGKGLRLSIDGTATTLRLNSSGVIFPPGAGGLPTMKMGFVYEASYPRPDLTAPLSLRYLDRNYEGHSGWKEIVAVFSSGSLINSSVPALDRSQELTNYPTDLLSSPPQTVDAAITWMPPVVSTRERDKFAISHPEVKAVAPSEAKAPVRIPNTVSRMSDDKVRALSSQDREPKRSLRSKQVSEDIKATVTEPSLAVSIPLSANQQKTPRSKFTELITEQHLSLWFLFTAAVIAVGLGALHALEPGHGKTIVAAYLVGSRGTARHAVLLGMIVTASHTAGVFALGAITLYASRYIVPEQLYPWLGVFSGITIAALGCYMLLRRLTGKATDHSHDSNTSHIHWPFAKRSLGAIEEPSEALLEEGSKRNVSLTQLFTLGITGGIIPCPAALIVLLSAFALHRVALGFFLIVAFSLGLAAVLIIFGMTMVYARRMMTRLQIDGPLTKRWLPMASSTFIMILGVGLAIQSFATTHLSFPNLSKERLGPLLFVTGLGLILGMRHSTDADHVVAISTIVGKQGSIRNAAVIGSVWGLGHTITIFVVGSLIILFGVVIPPRVGLTMEFSVAVMLVLLGIFNLTGLMRRVTDRFTRSSTGQPEAIAPLSLAAASFSGARGRLNNAVANLGWYQCLRPLVIGLVHGLAGSAAVALLVLSTIHNPYWASAYLVIFGIGTMIGMMGMTAAMAVPLAYAGDRFAILSRYFGVASGVVSLCFGSFLVYQLGYLGGLFTSHPTWTPQ